MKQEERQKWIERIVAEGGDPEKARIQVEGFARGYNDETAEMSCHSLLLCLQLTNRIVRPGPVATPQSQPPPMEIPRRVVMVTSCTVDGVSKAGETGILNEVRGTSHYITLDRREFGTPRLCASKNDFIELQLTDAENARLLLGQLSRESWEREGLKPEQRGEYYYIQTDGTVRGGMTKYKAFGLIPFPNAATATAARDAIIRAGLAWWKEGE